MAEVHQGVVTHSIIMRQLHCGRYTWPRAGGMADRMTGPRKSAVDAFYNLIHDPGPGGFRDHAKEHVTLITRWCVRMVRNMGSVYDS
jgi:hypothetical protein